jgi:hypothetical protein
MNRYQNRNSRQEILIMGGLINGEVIKTVIKMIIDENNEILNINFEESTPMLNARLDLSSIYWKNQVFSFGFINEKIDKTDKKKYTMEYINLSTQKQKEEGTLLNELCRTTPIIFNNAIHSIGGQILEYSRYLDYPHIYKFESKCLEKNNECNTRLNPFTSHLKYISRLNNPRHECAVCIYDNKLFICGGIQNNYTSSIVEVYNKHTNQCEVYKNMVEPRARFSLFVYNDELYAVGGNEYNRSSITSIEKMNKDTHEWVLVTNLGENRQGCSSILIGSKIFLIGGGSYFFYDGPSSLYIGTRKIRNINHESTFDFFDLKTNIWASKDETNKYYSENSRTIYLPSSYSFGRFIGKKRTYYVSSAQAVNITPSHNCLIRNRNNSNEYKSNNILFRDNVNDILFNASKYDKPNMIIFLIDQKSANINYKNENGITPLMIAILYNNFEIVELLLTLNADINLLDNNERSALWYACDCNNIKIINLLISKNPNINSDILALLNKKNFYTTFENKEIKKKINKYIENKKKLINI